MQPVENSELASVEGGVALAFALLAAVIVYTAHQAIKQISEKQK